MVFSSMVFLFLFLPLVLAGYYILPSKVRNAWLLVASLFFYAWGEPDFVLLMLGAIAFNWAAGLALNLPVFNASRHLVLGAGIAVNLGILAYFKYCGFFVDAASTVSTAFGWEPLKMAAPLLPVGISFMTFHSISYLVDVYRRISEPVGNPVNMGLYISMFPQLVAGPIIRYHDVEAQIYSRSNSVERFASGVERFVLGLAKKVLLANTVGQVADDAFGLPAHQLGALVAWAGIICYTLQIYLDFSAYSDMAIGLGRMFGFEYLENFNYPYMARSIQEFWRRWHLSLSSWFRDYLYIPLGGNRCGPARNLLNLFLVFFLCGLWHGASWNFVFWGCLHGAWLVLEKGAYGRFLAACPAPLSWSITMLQVGFAWIFFRADSFAHAATYCRALVGLGAEQPLLIPVAVCTSPPFIMLFAFGLIASTPLMAFLARDYRSRLYPKHSEMQPQSLLELRQASDKWQSRSRTVFACLLPILLLSSIASLAASTYNPFIYFRF